MCIFPSVNNKPGYTFFAGILFSLFFFFSIGGSMWRVAMLFNLLIDLHGEFLQILSVC